MVVCDRSASANGARRLPCHSGVQRTSCRGAQTALITPGLERDGAATDRGEGTSLPARSA